MAVAALAAVATAADTSDKDRDFAQLCQENGLQSEVHTVTTEDGYILELWRIPGKVGEEYSVKPPLLFQHGIFDSAYCWMVNYADVAPAFVAANAGYDVWLGNNRGNTYSRKHVTLDPDHDYDFWAWSWYEMGMYDQPAFIEHIRDASGNQKIAYIGHSEGTSQMFVGLAEMEDYFADKLSLFVGVGPVANISHQKSLLLNFVTDFYSLISDATWLFGIGEFMGANWLTTTATELFCETVTELCELLVGIFTNEKTDTDDDDRYVVYMGHEPNGASVQALLHYAQVIREDRFQIWSPDYTDWFDQDKKRHTDLIPIDTISKVPVALYCGVYDVIADCEDARNTVSQIGGDVIHYEEIEGGHLTFMVGKDMTYWTEGVMGLLAQYQPLSASRDAPYEQYYLQ